MELDADTYFPIEHVRQLVAELTQVAQLRSHRVHMLPELTNRSAWVHGAQVEFSMKRLFPAGHERQLVARLMQVVQLESHGAQVEFNKR